MSTVSNVFVVDDDAAIRDSLRMMLKAAGCTVSTFSSAEEFLTICNPETEGCVILDVNMPGMDGPELQEELNRRELRLPIIFLTGQGTIPLSVRTLKAGAMDFLVKPVDGTELLVCVKHALDKCLLLQQQASKVQSIKSLLDKLSEREKEIMRLIIDGLTNKEIANNLGISFRTVENHRAHIMQKTGSTNLLELARIVEFEDTHHH